MALVGCIDLGNLTNYLFFFGNGSIDANWQGASKGFVGNVAVNGLAASERTSGFVPYAGTIVTNASSLGAWQQIANANTGQTFESLNQVALINELEADKQSTFAQINALPATPGFESVDVSSLNGLDFTNGFCDCIVINVTSWPSGGISSKINIAGDACDVIILRWDQDANPLNGYQGQVKFQSGGAIVPQGGLIPTNFINVAGDISSSGGGTTPLPPYPQGPRFNNGQGTLINGGADFNGGGFFTGYWLTTGDPINGMTSPLSNAIFVGGWFTNTTSFSMTSGTSGVYVSPPITPSVDPCTETFSETVCVQATITIKPEVIVGPVEAVCIGTPTIGACPGTPVGSCTFSVSQNICVQIPLTFDADVETTPQGIVCGTPAIGPCT